MGTICIDFDGVLHSYTKGWQGAAVLEGPVEGAQAFVRWLQDQKYDVVIQSTRAKTADGYLAIMQWLGEHSFPGPLKVTSEKPPAFLYIDDRGYRFGGSFEEVKAYMTANPDMPTWTHRREP